MYQLPDVPAARVVKVFPERVKPLWAKALARPEADLKCQAAGAIARAARSGVKGLDSLIAPLVSELDRPEQHPSARLAVAEALIALDARESAPSLLRQAEAGSSELRDLVEPALARWDHRPAREVWLARLREPATRPRNLVLAIQGLAAVREGQAADRLRELALSERIAAPTRLEAARALALLREKGLEKDAEGLLTDDSPRGMVNRLVAASLLQRHRGVDATRLLQRLVKDREPAVAAVGAGRLLELDPDLLLPVLDRLLDDSADAPLRSFAVDALYRRPTEKHIRLLGDRLDDADTEVRRKARRHLRELAGKKEFHDAVIREGVRLLAGKEWRGQEQAAILLAQLDHKPAAARLVELLPADRPEAFVTAAWGLRKLNVAKALPGVREYVQAEVSRVLAAEMLPSRKDVAPVMVDHQLSQLNQLLGQQKDAAADDVLRPFIPHRMDRQMDECRAAAMWAFGMIHEGKAVPDLAAALEGRLNDAGGGMLFPENSWVRRMAAVSLARMGAKEALPSLRRHYPAGKPSTNIVNNACGWAIEKLTDGKEAMPPPKTTEVEDRNWFLAPDK
jgi:hypothetical protein